MAYNTFSKLFHFLAIGSDSRCEFMFDIERSIFSKNINSDDNHIFVCGLARSGTTVFMRAIYNSGEFASLTYRDMPFLLMPNIWGKISFFGSMKVSESERAHGDGIKINYDSPEALEEVFWRVFTGKQYIYNDILSLYTVNSDTLKVYKDYVSLICLHNRKKRYLSKNNNNILRVNSIIKLFPASSIIILFRNPLAQSSSLLNQHKLFSEKHSSDIFTRKYMGWLVHHEFGLDHKVFDFHNRKKKFSYNDPFLLEHWLEQWIHVYKNLVQRYSHSSNVYFICYEDLCSDKFGEIIWNKITNKFRISSTNTNFKNANIISKIESSVLLDSANEVYSQMRRLSFDKLGIS